MILRRVSYLLLSAISSGDRISRRNVLSRPRMVRSDETGRELLMDEILRAELLEYDSPQRTTAPGRKWGLSIHLTDPYPYNQ
jgi:hypothetical protein